MEEKIKEKIEEEDILGEPIELVPELNEEDFIRKHIAGMTIPRSKDLRVRKFIHDFSKFWYRVPILDKLLIKKKVKKGFIVGEVIYPNRNAVAQLIDLRYNAFIIPVTDSKDKIFYLGPIKEKPEDYIKYVDQIPTVAFDWKTGMPIPINKDVTLEFDEDYFSDIVVRARLTGSSEKLVEWLKQNAVLIKAAAFGSMISAGLQLAVWLGIL